MSMTKGERTVMQSIADLARQRTTYKAGDEQLLEAHVISLFGLSKTAAKRVLEYRGVTKPAISEVLKEL
jgi:hypothetical protein